MAERPTGTVTFLFTDVEGSTRLWAADPEAMSASLRAHDAVVRSSIESSGGYVFTTAGDSFCAAFQRVSDALEAVELCQGALAGVRWPGPELKVRMGLHLGEAEERDGDYFGPVVNTAARVESVGHGGQVLVTEAVRQAGGLGSVVDLGEHSLRGVDGLVHLYQLDPGTHPELRTQRASVSVLPTARTSFVGRRREMGEVLGLLDQHRLVTITGVGGCGKTRLALEVAAELERETDGVFFVDLTAVDDADGVSGALVSGIGLQSVRSPLDAVFEFLSPRRCALVLDNCEHVLDEVAEVLDELLNRCPTTVVLTTSREAVEIEGERAWRIPPLESGPGSAAVQLFADRAEVNSVERSEQIAVAEEICARLDGIPLAIELAAAKTRSMSVEEINERLDDRFRLLSGGRRRSRQRQQTLAGMLEWSYELLDDDERSMLNRLSVFFDGFELDDAAAVTGFDDHSATELIDSLVAKSLVDMSRDVEGRPRRRLLETIRLFAVDQLIRDGEAEETRRAHYERFAERVRGPVIRQVQSETEGGGWRDGANYWAAIEWADDNLGQNESNALAARCVGAVRGLGRDREVSRRFAKWLSDNSHPTTSDDWGAIAHSFMLFSITGATLEQTNEFFDLIDNAAEAGDPSPDVFCAEALCMLRRRWTAPEAMIDRARRRIAATDDLPSSEYLEGLMHMVISDCSFVLGRHDDALDAARSMLALTPDSAVGLWGAIYQTQLLVLLDRADEAARLPLGGLRGYSNWSHLPSVMAASAALGREPAEAGRVVAGLAGRAISGRVSGQEGDFLDLFVWLRHRVGDTDRVHELLDGLVTLGPNRLSLEIELAFAEGARNERLATLAAISERRLREVDRRRDAMPRLLAEEIAHWDQPQTHPGAMDLPSSPLENRRV